MTQSPVATHVALTHTEVPASAQVAKLTDTFDIDQETHTLYYGDNWTGGVDIFDISTPSPKYVTTVRTMGNVFGVTVAKNVQKVYVGIANSMLGVIDISPASPTFNTLLKRIDTGGRAAVDLVGYDPEHRKVYPANRGDGFITSVDAETDTIVKKIVLGLGLEQPFYNSMDGMMYVTTNTDSVLYQVDPKTDLSMHKFIMGIDSRLNGVGYNPKTNQALLVSSNRDHPQHIMWDFNDQRIANVITGLGSGDGGMYSPAVDLFFTGSSGHAGGPVVGIIGGQPAHLLATVPTGRTGSWVGLDETNKIVYVPTILEGRAALTGFPLPDA